MALTTYIILEQVEVTPWLGASEAIEVQANGDEAELPEEPEVSDVFMAFRKVGAVNAHSSEQAFRMAGEEHGAGHYAICSERHWNEETLEVETTTRVTVKSS